MIFFFHGPNSYASRQKVRQMTDVYLKKTGSDMGLERINGSEVTLQQLSGALMAAPFMATSRLVIIDRLSENKKLAEVALKLLPQVPSTTVAVFYEVEVDKRTAYFKELAKLAQVATFESLAQPQLAAWVKKEVAAAGGTIDRAALNLLLDWCGEDQWRLEQEIIKLVSHSPEITTGTIKELVEPTYHQTIFDLVDAMTAGDAAASLRHYHRLLAEQMNELYILTMVTWQLRNLLLAKAAGPMSAQELAGSVGMSPFVAGKALGKAGQFEEQLLRGAMLAAIDTEYDIKNGLGEAEQLLERLIYRVATRSLPA